MKSLLTKVAVATAAGAALTVGAMNVNPAEAASFNFSYTLQNGSILSGMLDGDVQADGDTVFVTSVSMPTFNGVAGPDLPFLNIPSYLLGGSGTPTVSISGLLMSFLACDSPVCSDGFLFESSGAVFGLPLYNSGSSYGSSFESYDSSKWQLTAKNPVSVPEPASVLGLLGMGALGVASKLKKGKAE